MPPVIRNIAADYYRCKIKQQIHGHGMGKHRAVEIFTRGIHDIDALSTCLNDKKYFLGNQPTTLDASAFGMLVNTLRCPIESPLKEYALTKNNLIQYVDRITANYYPDLLTA
ncbi:glutathione S-transferase C-terminal domain-containing protein [Nitrosomonas sp. Is37]|uniref:glutathione S-transferase C-terminal domain-containing protein n=1 Tax=Nitrosomonas sp. Is37 TaxID=3080535 RepID=UPI00294B0A7E|nr:glutathione S-transferase C-terminal domain-containing protein [Nitrosomonas sp. Is37]MDV6343478.1 glutathione S-transferase C-terminal domain-containing protein [Nitrosomonas sp. Is37]